MLWLFAIIVLALLVFSPGFRKTAFALVVLAVVAFGIYAMRNAYENRPRVVEELAGIRLGMSPVDVKLAKGAPNNEDHANVERARDGGYSLDWFFQNGSYSPRTDVIFYGKQIDGLRASIVCEKDGYSRPFGLGSYSTEADVLDKLGQPTNTSIAEDGLSKMVSFK